MSSGKYLIFTFMYSSSSIGLARKKSLMSAHSILFAIVRMRRMLVREMSTSSTP